METTKLKANKKSLAKGQILFIIVIALVVSLNAAALFLYLLPELESLKLASQSVDQKNVILQKMKTEYTNEKVSDKQIQQLTDRVPVERADSDSLLSLLDNTYNSEAPFVFVTQPNGDEEEAGPKKSVAEDGTVTSTFKVLVLGHLPNLLLYIDNLQKQEQLFSLQEWSFKEMTKEDINKDHSDIYTFPFIKKDKPVFALRLSVQSYILPQYQDAFRKASETEAAEHKSA
jgi:hypothetical protein